MQTARTALALALSAALAAAAMAEDWGKNSDEYASSTGYAASKALCRSLKGREPPVADRPDARTRASLKGCDSEALYYGIGIKADPVRARLCAFTDEPDGQPIEPFAGRAMLMVIYANGVGARRDLDVATRLACQVDGAPAEYDLRVNRLAKLKAARWGGRDFHFCDDITSGLAGGYCAGHRARIAEPKRRAALGALTARWSVAEKRALAVLQQAHEAFIEAHGAGEMDRSGTLRVALEIQESERLRDELVDMLRRLSADRAPRYSAAQFAHADKALNDAYSRILRGPDPGEGDWGATKEGVRDAQRAWLRYRDAFLALARIRFPHTSHKSLAAWLTRKRTGMLPAIGSS